MPLEDVSKVNKVTRQRHLVAQVTVELFTIEKIQNQLRCSLADKRIRKMWCRSICPPQRRKEILSFATMWPPEDST